MGKISRTAMLFLVVIAGVVLPVQKTQAAPETYHDDFSLDSGMWEYLGSAYRDPANEYLVLTQPINYQGGVAFFNTSFRYGFTANFNYKAGGGSGADGFVIFFYKQKYATFETGGHMAFSDGPWPNPPIIFPGYGIEFDNWFNGIHNDPSDNHIALIRNHVDTHLIYTNDLRTEDNSWHDVSVTVGESSVQVTVDGGLVLDWSGTIDRTFDTFGFCAGTGAATNWHIIDDFSIEIHSPPQTYSLTIATTVGGTTDPIPETYDYAANSTAQVTAIPDAHYLFDHWELDNVNVGSSNPYNVTMDQNHTLEALFASIPPLTVSIDPTSATIILGQSVNFESMIHGGLPPYSYQWYVDASPVTGANLSNWIFTPIAIGTYAICLNVTDSVDTEVKSNDATVTVLHHDVAVVDVTPSRAWVYQGFKINISVAIENQGNFTETVVVKLYYNITEGSLIGTQTTMLNVGETGILVFAWDTTGVQYCHNYTLTAVVEIALDSDTTDNKLEGSMKIKVRIPGDLNGDGQVGIDDIFMAGGSFGAFEGDDRWNPNADLNQPEPDGYVGIDDIFIIARNFGEECP